MSDNSTLPATGELIATDELNTINGLVAEAGLKVQRAKIGFGADGDFNDANGSNPLPTTDVLLQELNDTILYMLAAILEKMPRVTGNDQTAVSIEGGAVGISSGQTLATVSNVANMTNIGGRYTTNVADAMTMAGTSHIYNNITVS